MSVNYVLIEKITVGANAPSSVTFSSIPQTGYTDLVVRYSSRVLSGTPDLSVSFNGVSTNLSDNVLFYYSGAVGTNTSSTIRATVNMSTQTTNTFGNAEIYIPNYTSAVFKSLSIDSVAESNESTNAFMYLTTGLWSNTAAINSITLTANAGSFATSASFYLYGVAKLGTTPAIAPYATGGATIMTDGSFWYHAFTSSGTFTPTRGLSCDVLVVAGGGSGGGTTCCGVWPGGGGAGGVFYAGNQSVGSAQTVTIGAGGAAPVAGGHPNGNQGSNSQFGSLTAAVGGGFGSGIQQSGGAGGSGGGAGDFTDGQLGGAATAGQGFAGGNGGGGGGGGAGAVGTAGTRTANGVAGGIGTNAYSSWLSPTGVGIGGYIAGGGGGAASSGGIAGPGGLGGAGSGGLYQANGNAAVANTGSGGGAGGQSQGPNTIGGAGGSGLVIVRYAV